MLTRCRFDRLLESSPPQNETPNAVREHGGLSRTCDTARTCDTTSPRVRAPLDKYKYVACGGVGDGVTRESFTDGPSGFSKIGQLAAKTVPISAMESSPPQSNRAKTEPC